MLALCTALFGELSRARAGLLGIALSNVNPRNHLAIALCNFTRMERGETWFQNTNITSGVGRLMEALDAERLAIAAALGVQVRTFQQHLRLSFHTPEAPLGEMAHVLAADGQDSAASISLDSCDVLEDAPLRLYSAALLGRLCGRPVPLQETGLLTLSPLHGHDLADPASGGSLTADRPVRAAVHRVHDEGQVPAAAAGGVRGGGAVHRHVAAGHPGAPHPALRPAATYRADGARHRRRDPGGGHGQLPGLRRPEIRALGAGAVL